jgi:hypothetical protein
LGGYLITTPIGYDNASSLSISDYFASIGAFDYQYTNTDGLPNHYQVLYTDFDRSDKESIKKKEIQLGIIGINKNERKITNFPLASEADSTFYLEAKSGYILVIEYFQKEKKIIMHLEKIG